MFTRAAPFFIPIVNRAELYFSMIFAQKADPEKWSNCFNIFYSWMTSRNPLGFFSILMDYDSRSNGLFLPPPEGF
jgi:hypothetical protein